MGIVSTMDDKIWHNVISNRGTYLLVFGLLWIGFILYDFSTYIVITICFLNIDFITAIA